MNYKPLSNDTRSFLEQTIKKNSQKPCCFCCSVVCRLAPHKHLYNEFDLRAARSDMQVRANRDLLFGDPFPYLEQQGSLSFNETRLLLAPRTMSQQKHAHSPGPQ